MKKPTFILASSSQSRATLLTNAGIEFVKISPAVDEADIKQQFPDDTGQELALRLAKAKALDVSKHNPDILVLGADQVLHCGGTLFDKPKSKDEARDQLKQLRDKTHHLLSAVACAKNGEIIWTDHDDTALSMRNFSDEFLESYLTLAGSSVLKSVGAYQLEGFGIQLFDEIDGDYFTILGLPLLSVLAFLREQSIVAA